jgi:CheY-like chemotaxis protein
MPIIALTANVMEEHAQECKGAGMDAFLSKPLRSDAMTVVRSYAVAWSEACILRKERESVTGSLPLVPPPI